MKLPLTLRTFLLASLLAPVALAAGEEPKEILLWPNGAPGSEGKTGAEIVERGANGERKVSSIHHPSLTPAQTDEIAIVVSGALG